MRSIGQNPTEDEILELVMEADLNGDGTIDFQEFIEMMKRKSSETDQTEVFFGNFSKSLRKNIALTSCNRSLDHFRCTQNNPDMH